jgi:hypothetical protein
MLSKGRKIACFSIFLVVVLIACKTALYIPGEIPGTTMEEVRELSLGRAAYIGKCSSCHTLYRPEKYTPAEWQSQVVRMSARSKLTKEEEVQVVKYLSRGR